MLSQIGIEHNWIPDGKINDKYRFQKKKINLVSNIITAY